MYSCVTHLRRLLSAGRGCGLLSDNYKAANEAANNGKERKDLYTDAWDGDVYKGATNPRLALIALSVQR